MRYDTSTRTRIQNVCVKGDECCTTNAQRGHYYYDAVPHDERCSRCALTINSNKRAEQNHGRLHHDTFMVASYWREKATQQYNSIDIDSSTCRAYDSSAASVCAFRSRTTRMIRMTHGDIWGVFSGPCFDRGFSHEPKPTFFRSLTVLMPADQRSRWYHVL